MLQVRQNLAFILETAKNIVSFVARAQQLDGDLFPVLQIGTGGETYHAHASPPQLAFDPIRSDLTVFKRNTGRRMAASRGPGRARRVRRRISFSRIFRRRDWEANRRNPSSGPQVSSRNFCRSGLRKTGVMSSNLAIISSKVGLVMVAESSRHRPLDRMFKEKSLATSLNKHWCGLGKFRPRGRGWRIYHGTYVFR